MSLLMLNICLLPEARRGCVLGFPQGSDNLPGLPNELYVVILAICEVVLLKL